jgi:ABC-2 type transport system ATP-binding protein
VEPVSALSIRGLSHRFGNRAAVRDLDLTVHEGDVYGFLGPNGAGKTTVIRCVLGLLRPTSGEIRLFGETGTGARRVVGAIVETPAFHAFLSGRDNLRVAAAYAGLGGSSAESEIGRVLERVGLTERASDKAGGYSLGMRQRLAIARALLGRPKLLVLDEPTNGLDPQGMREVRDLVRSLALHDRITVFLSSHLLTEIQAICNRVGIVTDGALRAEGPVADLLAQSGSPIVRVEFGGDTEALRAALSALDGVTVEGPGGDGRLRAAVRGRTIPAVVRALVEAGVELEAVVPDKRSLEDVFLEVTTGAPR